MFDFIFGGAAWHTEPRSTMRGRGKSAATIRLRGQAHHILERSASAMTLRQLYYALVSAGAIDKTEAQYTRLKRIVKDAREDGLIPWEWLVDNTRSVIAHRTWDSLEGLLKDSAKIYRADLMRQQQVAIQLWAESDSVGSVISQVADQYGIPTFIGRGYSARGYLWDAATDAVTAWQSGQRADDPRSGKHVHILHVGDHDPSGVDIFRDVEETLRLYCLAVLYRSSASVMRDMTLGMLREWEIEPTRESYIPGVSEYCLALRDDTEWLHVERIALTPGQVMAYDLPVRPPKASDRRARKFTGAGSVEVEALSANTLLAIVENAITSRIDTRQLELSREEETMARETAAAIAAKPIDRLVAA